MMLAWRLKNVVWVSDHTKTVRNVPESSKTPVF